MDNRWWTKETKAVVTGAQRGIGFAIARKLASKGLHVILTDRDGEGGSAAIKTLNDAGFHNVVFYQLDVQDGMAVHEFGNWMKQQYGELDILVNNAGILGVSIDYDILKANQADPLQIFHRQTVEGITENCEMAKKCIDTNYYGTKRMVEALLPLLKLRGETGGRIVNVSSRAGLLEHIPSETLRQELNDLGNLTEDKIETFLERFLKDFQRGVVNSNGWPSPLSAYCVSKAAINAYTRLLAQRHPELYVNCVHPGNVNTDMTFKAGVLSTDEGAEGAVMLALLPPGSPSGHYYNKKEIASFYFLHQ